MMVTITVVVMLVVKIDNSLGGGGGSTAPGECIIPANAGTVSVRVRASTVPIRLNLFTCGAS